MKHFRKILKLRTARREETVDITPEVEGCAGASGIMEGLALVYPLHTSSAVYIGDSDGALAADTAAVLARLVPEGAGYGHDETDFKKNAHAHIRAALAGHHAVLPVTEGRLELGAYQTVYYAEFDGKREKKILVKIIGE